LTFLIEQSLKPAELLKKIELIEKESAAGIKRLEERITVLENNVVNWIGITFENGWEFASSEPIASFSRDHINVVRFRGLANGPSGVRAFILPVGYRPMGEAVFPLIQLGVHLGAAVVKATGPVELFLTETTNLSLDGIEYIAEH